MAFFSMISTHSQLYYCPDFIKAGINATSLPGVLATGAVIAIEINWLCDLDQSTTTCNPAYSFKRLDINNPVRLPYPSSALMPLSLISRWISLQENLI